MVRGSMARITRSQAEQIVNAYSEISQISAQFPGVFARKHSDESYYPMATVEYNSDGIQVYVHLDAVKVVMKNVDYCLITNDGLAISGTGGLLTVDISDE